MPRRPLRALGLQVANTSDAAAARARAWELVHANPGHHLYVLPELGSTGYSDSVLGDHAARAETEAGETCAFYKSLANEVGAHVCFGILRRSGADVHICQGVAAPGGRLTLYDKMHLCDMGACSEVGHGLSRGARPATFECQGWTVGLAICYDLRFPELWRKLAWDEGCDVILHPSAFARDATFPCYHPFVTTRAVENQVYVLSVNFAGDDFGASISVPPWIGPVPGVPDQAAATLQTGEDVLPLVCDDLVLCAVRDKYPYRRNRHPLFRDGVRSLLARFAALSRGGKGVHLVGLSMVPYACLSFGYVIAFIFFVCWDLVKELVGDKVAIWLMWPGHLSALFWPCERGSWTPYCAVLA